MTTITLQFAGTPVEVPLRQTLSKSLLREAEPHLTELRNVGVNKAYERAIAENPHAMKNLAEHIKANAGESLNPQEMAGDFLFEAYPAIYAAMQSPETHIDLTNDVAVTAMCKLVDVLLDKSQLNEVQKSTLAMDTFWDDQDLEGCRAAVTWFRGRL